jgi:lipopolysaccharide export system permease protein
VNPRGGRSLNLVVAVLVYMVYSNFQSVAQVWVAVGKVSPAMGIWGVHLAMALAVALLFRQRLSVFRLARGAA